MITDNNGHSETVDLTGRRHGKNYPEFTFNPNHVPYYFGDTIHTVAASTNEQTGLTYSSGNSSIAEITDGNLVIKNTASPVTITVHQDETADYRESAVHDDAGIL